MLIQLEQALGFYEDGLFVDHQTLYPAKWKTAWLTDRTGLHYYASLCGLTGIFLLDLGLKALTAGSTTSSLLSALRSPSAQNPFSLAY